MSMYVPRRAGVRVACLAIFAATSSCTFDFSGNETQHSLVEPRDLQDSGVTGDEPVGVFDDE